jgi:hypothetical protein
MPQQQQQQPQQRPQNRNNSPGGANLQPSNSLQAQPPPPPQQQQSRPPHSFPWAARRIVLLPPTVINRPGIAPPTSPSPSPFPRYGHALPATATPTGELYIFGGLVRETARNDVYMFNTLNNSASLVQTTGVPPSPRMGHASALVGNVIIVWGGDTNTDPNSRPDEKQDNGLYLLNLSASSLQFLPFVPCPHFIYSVARMEYIGCYWPSTSWQIRACGSYGWIKVFCFWWTSRRRILE